MAQTIKLKRSATSGATPTTSQLELGEVAINTYDGKMYIKKNVGGTESIVEITGGSGGSSNLSGLSDVTISSAAADQLLQYNGSEWVNVSIAEASAIMKEYQFTATAGQSTFTGSDDNSETLSYTAGAIQVFLNGIFLDSAVDYTATNGTSVVLSETVDANDYLQVVAFKKKIGDGNVSVDTFTGDDSTVDFTLSVDPGDENNTRVFIDGVYQSKSNYSVSGTTLTFSTAPPTGTAVEVEIGNRVVTLDTLSDLDLPDDVKLRLGTDQDLQIYHDGSNSYIKDTGTGSLAIQASQLNIDSSNGSEYQATFVENGAVSLYYDGRKKFETTNDGVTVTGDVEADEFIGDLRGAILFKAQAGEALAKGDVVYISGISGNTTIVSKADADDASKMPAFGLAAAASTSGTTVEILTSGILSEVDTSAYSEGDELFVSTTAGALTATAPTGESAALQKIGKVTRSNNLSGSIFITGAGRSNAVPNLDDGDIFLGNSSNQAVSASLNTKIEEYLDSGVSTASFASLTFDNYTLDSNKISTNQASGYNGDIFLDAANVVVLDAANAGVVQLKNNGSHFGSFFVSSDSLNIQSNISDADIVFKGNDGGSAVTALTLDMSDAGAATFNSSITVTGTNANLTLGASGNDITFGRNADNYINAQAGTSSNIVINPENRFVVNTSDTERMRIDSSGRVGIGTTSPNYLLDVEGTGATIARLNSTSGAAVLQISVPDTTSINDINFGDSGSTTSGQIRYRHNGDSLALSTAGTERMRIDSSGRVGIGTTSPTQKLDIRNSGSAAAIKLRREDTSNEMLILIGSSYGYVQNTTGPLGLGGSGGDRDLFIATSGNVGIGTTTPSHLLHVTGADGSIANMVVNNDNVALRMSAYTNSHGEIRVETNHPLVIKTNGNNERMRITATGNVGIGTTSPSEKLEVNGRLKVQAGDAATSAYSIISNGGDLVLKAGADDVVLRTGGSGSEGIYFQDGAQNTKMVINAENGNVGIGTDSPSADLHIADSAAVLRLEDTDNNSYGEILYNTASGGLILRSDENAATGTTGSQIIFETDGTQKVKIDSSGNVGIGTSSPGRKLTVQGTSDAYIKTDATSHTSWTIGSDTYGFLVYDDDVGGIDGYRIVVRQTSGNVGIGLTDPDQKLDVNGNIRIPNEGKIVFGSAGASPGDYLELNDVNSSGSLLKLVQDSTTRLVVQGVTGNLGIGTTSPSVPLHVDGSGRFDLSSGETLYLYRSSASNLAISLGSANTDLSSAGTINFKPEGTTIQKYQFKSADFIINGPNVGIGTTSPQAKLHIDGDGTYASIRGYSQVLDLGNWTNGEVRIESTGAPFHLRAAGNQPIHLETDNVERVTVLGTGNVGIGTTSPEERLHVSGKGTFENAGNVNRGNLILGPHGSGTAKWATLAGTHYNEAAGSGNGSGNAGIMMIGSHAQSGSNQVYIGHGPYELNPATHIRLGTHTADTHNLGGTTHMIIDSAGRVGIGTTTPAQKFHIEHTPSSGYTATSFNAGAAMIIRHTNTDGLYGGIRFTNTSGNYEHFIGAVQTGSNTADMVFQGYNRTAGAYQEHMRVKETGQVGIGHTSPKSMLSIVGDGGVNTYSGVIGIENTDGDPWGSISLTDDIDAASASSNFYLIGRGGSHADRVMSLHIPTASDYGSGAQPRIIFASTGADTLFSVEASTGTTYHKGAVGIGTISPSETLTLDGDSLTTGTVFLGPNNGSRRPFAKSSNWGYSTAYRVAVLGSASNAYNTAITGSTTISFNYDPSGNSDSSFGGDGREILFRNGTQFVTPNDADNDFNLYNLVLKDGNVGIGTSSPSANLDVIDPVSGNFDGKIHIGGNGSNRRLILEQTDVLTYTIGGTGTSCVTRFVSGGSAGTGTERMRISSEGTVGIGVTPSDNNSATYKLQLYAPSQCFMSFGNSTTGSGNSNGLIIGNDSTGADIYQREAKPLRFHTTNTERMRIESTGVVRQQNWANDYRIGGAEFVEIRAGRRYGTGTYTLFTNGVTNTQSSGTVTVEAIYGTPSGAGIWKYVISGNRNISLIYSNTSIYPGSTPAVSWNGATLEVTNSDSNTYYSVVVELHNIGNSWAATWGNFPGFVS